MADAPATPGTIQWVAQDSRGVAAATSAAYTRAVSLQWGRDEASTRDLRGLVLAACLASAELSPEPPVLQQGSLIVHPTARTSRDDNRDFQSMLMWGVVYLLGCDQAGVQSGAYNLPTSIRIETEDGSPPSAPTDTAIFPWVAVVAIVVAGSAIAGVLALWLTQNNEIALDKLASDERLQKHAAALAALSSAVDAHVQHEQATGQTLPWDPEEVSYLDTMKQSIATLSATPEPTLKSAPDLASVTQATAGAITNVGVAAKDAGKGVGIGAGVVVVALIALFLFDESKSARRERREAA